MRQAHQPLPVALAVRLDLEGVAWVERRDAEPPVELERANPSLSDATSFRKLSTSSVRAGSTISELSGVADPEAQR